MNLSTLSIFEAFNGDANNSPYCKPMWQMQSDAVVDKLTGTRDVNCRSQPHGRETSDVNWTSERLNFQKLLLSMWTTEASIISPDCTPVWHMQSDAVVNKLTGTQDVNCRSQPHGRETSDVSLTSERLNFQKLLL